MPSGARSHHHGPIVLRTGEPAAPVPPNRRYRFRPETTFPLVGTACGLLLVIGGATAGGLVALALTAVGTAWMRGTSPDDGHAGTVVSAEAPAARPVTPRMSWLSPAGLFWADAQGRVRWANPACRRLVGEGDRWRDWVRPDHRRLLPSTVEAMLEVQVPLVEVSGRAPRSVRLCLTPHDGGVAGTLEDITEVTLLQDTLARRESAYELLAANTSEIVVRTDITGLVHHASPALRRLLGHTDAGVTGAPIDRLFVPEHGPRIREAVVAVSRGGRPSHLTGRLKGRADLDVWVDITMQPRRTQRHDQVVEIDVSMRDITDRRWVEEELLARNRLLDTVTEASPVGIFALRGARWTFVNERLAEIAGLDTEELLDGRLWEFVHPEDRLQLEVDRSLWTAPADGDPRPDGFVGGYYRLVRPDGEERWIHLRMAAVEGDREGGWVGTVEDTTNEVTARQHTTLLATVVAATTDLVAIMNPDGGLRFLNPAGRELLGHTSPDGGASLHGGSIFGRAGWRRLCEVALPVATARGTWSGDAEVIDGDGLARPVSLVIVAHKDAVGRVDRLSLLARDTSTQKAVERRLEQAASHDQLTGLPNRSNFHDALTEALATASHSDSPVAVLFCDLDRFKAVNDSLGHAAGDELLREVATRLARLLRSGDVAARVGGDEFLVLAGNVEGPAEAMMVGERIREALDAPIDLDGQEVQLSFSVGVATSTPDDDPKRLIARADEAMYRAKELGKNRVQLHEPGTRRGMPATLVVEQSLRRAVEQDQLRLHYQPMVDLRTGMVTGAEALVRWNHPEHGLLPPRSFIDLAEETGLIRPLGRWVLAEAIRQAGAWAKDLTLPGGLVMSVNLSTQQLVDGDLAERTAAMMTAMDLPSGALFVELTERAIAADEDMTRRELCAFRDLGVGVALDDFGTGWSSLAQLRRFPVDALKLDATFVGGLGRSPADDAIISTVQGLADALGLQTIAEGVEVRRQARELLELGCTTAQGFLYSRPLPAGEFAALVRNGPLAIASAGPAGPDGGVHGRGHLAEDAGPGGDHALHH